MTMRARSGRAFWMMTLGLVVSMTAVPAARQFQTIDVTDSLRVTIDADWAGYAAPGYFPVRFEIANSGEARTIELVGHGARSYAVTRGPGGAGTPGSAGSTLLSQSVRLAPNDRVRLTIPVPIYADTESMRFEVREGGNTLYRFAPSGLQSRITALNASALVVLTPESPLNRISMRAFATMISRPTSGGRGGAVITMKPPVGRSFGRPLDFQLEPSRLPTNWLGYTSLRAVAIGPAEWEQLTDSQKAALLAWIGSGGDLIYVDGDIKNLLPNAQVQASTDAGRTTARHLFGRVHAVPLSAVETGLAPVLSALDKDREPNWALPANGAHDWGTVERGGFRLRIPGVEGVPARAYLGILLLFAVVIGPLNYWILRRKGRQVLVVLTAPLISIGFIAVLAAYAIVGQGFQIVGRAVTVTMIDQVSKQAATRATVSLYAPGLSESGGLRFGRESAVWAVGPEGNGLRDAMELDLTEAQHFSSGVLQSRSATNFEQVTFRMARERLTFSAAGSSLTVTNGLGATVIALFYRQGDTIYSIDGPLPAGGKLAMKAGAFDSRRVWPAGVAVPGRLFNLIQHQPTGSYLAILEQSPFWESGVSSVTERGSVHLVVGWPEAWQ